MTANKPMTGEQLDELMTVAVNMQRAAEVVKDRGAAMFSHAVQIAVMEIRDTRSKLADSQREFRSADATSENLQMKVEKLAAENAYLLNGAAHELNTSWMFHKTMLGAQAALVCISRGDIKAARDWLEGITDEAGADIPDEITVAELQAWFDNQMVSNDRKSGFLTRQEAEEKIRAECPETAAVLAEAEAKGVDAAIEHLLNKFAVTDHIGVPVMALEWLAKNMRDGSAS